MKRVIMPKCPYCRAEYHGEEPLDRLYPVRKLITCQRCKERYYVAKQERYFAYRAKVMA